MTWQIFVFGWVICGILAAGFNNAYYRSEYPDQSKIDRMKDLNFSLWWGVVGGPLSLLIQLGAGNWLHGWSLSWRPRKRDYD